MKRINILFVMLQMAMGGTERLVYDLASNLDHELFNPSIVWFFGDEILTDFENLEIPLYRVPKTKRFDFLTTLKLGNIIKNNDIQIVNAHHFMPMVYAFYGCKIMKNIKLIYTEHSKWEIDQITWKWRIIGRFLLNRLDGVVGVNEGMLKSIENKFKLDPSKTFAIRNGVNLGVFASNKEKATFKRKLGLASNEKVIGIVANFRKIKNHIFLLKAFNDLIKEYKNVNLLMVGQGFEGDAENSEQEIRNFIDKKRLNQNVLFLGYRSDIPDLLSVMDVFCLTSFKEGLPISLIEAMAAELPVIGTNVEGIKDVIIHNKNGFLVEIGDVKGLKNVLYTLLTNESLRHKFGQESKSLAISTYSLKRCINEYQDLFVSVLKKNNDLIFK